MCEKNKNILSRGGESKNYEHCTYIIETTKFITDYICFDLQNITSIEEY